MSEWLSNGSTALWTGVAAAVPLAYFWYTSTPVGPTQRAVYGAAVTPKHDGESSIYRSFRTIGVPLPRSYEEAATIHEAFEYGMREFLVHRLNKRPCPSS